MSGLVVVSQDRPPAEIERELKRIDPELFLDQEWSREKSSLFWTVKFWNGERAPEQVTVVVDWRDKQGNPLPMTWGIVNEVKRIAAQGGVSFAAIARKNQELTERRDDISYMNYEEAAKESARWLRRKPIFRRSQAYAAAKRRTRERGGEWG